MAHLSRKTKNGFWGWVEISSFHSEQAGGMKYQDPCSRRIPALWREKQRAGIWPTPELSKLNCPTFCLDVTHFFCSTSPKQCWLPDCRLVESSTINKAALIHSNTIPSGGSKKNIDTPISLNILNHCLGLGCSLYFLALGIDFLNYGYNPVIMRGIPPIWHIV